MTLGKRKVIVDKGQLQMNVFWRDTFIYASYGRDLSLWEMIAMIFIGEGNLVTAINISLL